MSQDNKEVPTIILNLYLNFITLGVYMRNKTKKN